MLSGESRSFRRSAAVLREAGALGDDLGMPRALPVNGMLSICAWLRGKISWEKTQCLQATPQQTFQGCQRRCSEALRASHFPHQPAKFGAERVKVGGYRRSKGR